MHNEIPLNGCQNAHDRILRILKSLLFFTNKSSNGKIIRHFPNKTVLANLKPNLGFDGQQ